MCQMVNTFGHLWTWPSTTNGQRAGGSISQVLWPWVVMTCKHSLHCLPVVPWQERAAVAYSRNQLDITPFIGFFFFPVVLLHSYSGASWNHFPHELPALKFLSQDIPSARKMASPSRAKARVCAMTHETLHTLPSYRPSSHSLCSSHLDFLDVPGMF